jgi:uncharacterized protein (DUF3820 family)
MRKSDDVSSGEAKQPKTIAGAAAMAPADSGTSNFRNAQMEPAEEKLDDFDFLGECAMQSKPLMTRAELLSTRMTWGAFKGRRVAELTLKYLTWLARKCKSIDARFRHAVELLIEELEAEGFEPDSRRQLLVNGPALAEAWKEEMLNRHHPDLAKNGSKVAVRLIEEGYDVLQRIVRGD